ncbi:hypothetical protein QA612_16600 [Evansella sp. AB-P1]|uniref:hypothetical protein n=1 Tax=Evansella sp. AB-P1 TaxID=3037653 RepID=UPI00241E68B2|nr:hypothetical protein [Evansella sp. AB-P1]MDG5789078.1 hypothetical protein [Evansella sp. AB-P1]
MYYESNQLSKPLFMKHYYERSWHEDWNPIQFRLHYLTNKGDPISVASISIPDKDLHFRHKHEHTFGTYQYQYQELREVMVELDYYTWGSYDHSDELSIEEVIVHFTDGSKEVISVGKIKFNIKDDEGYEGMLMSSSSGSSSDNTGYTNFSLEESIVVEGFHVPFQSHLSDALSIRINNEEINYNSFPITMEDSQLLRIDYSLSFKEDEEPYQHFYEIEIPFHISTLEGEKRTANVTINYQPYFSDSLIREIVAERGQR